MNDRGSIKFSLKRKGLEQEEDYSLWEMLKNRTILINILLMIVAWSLVSFDYYMISFYMKYIDGVIFINSIFSALSECLAYTFAGVIAVKFGIKRSLVFSFALGAAFAVGLLFTDTL